MSSKLFIILLFIPIVFYGNMAQPWVDGATHSTLYGAKNCQVRNENIKIQLSPDDDVYFAKYSITYNIHSNVNQTVPLVFIGLGLSDRKFVTVNNTVVLIKKYNAQNTSEISFSENDRLSVSQDDLIYFEAALLKGDNTICIEYNASLEYNTQGFIRTYKVQYSLYPSKYWESFGPITLDVLLGDDFKITSSNIGKPTLEKSKANWIIKTIQTDTIELKITKKTNCIANILLLLHPIGISVLFLVLLFLSHLKLLIQQHRKKTRKLKYVLWLGILLVPILYYLIFFLSFSLIDFTLGQESTNHGYTFLYIFTFPVLVLFYGLLLWLINQNLKIKYR